MKKYFLVVFIMIVALTSKAQMFRCTKVDVCTNQKRHIHSLSLERNTPEGKVKGKISIYCNTGDHIVPKVGDSVLYDGRVFAWKYKVLKVYGAPQISAPGKDTLLTLRMH